MPATPRSSRQRFSANAVGRLIGSLLLALGAVLVGPLAHAAATAAPCVPQTVQISTVNARAVFTGVVTAVVSSEPTGARGAFYTHDVTVDRVYKGSIGTETVQVRTERGPQTCGLGQLMLSGSYVFFAQAGGDLWTVTGDGGTEVTSEQLVRQVVRLLGEGRLPLPVEDEEAVLTPLAPEAPIGVTRAAAPGMALVLLGLLGLFVVRRLAR